MELDNDDGGNGVGSKDIGETPIKSTEPNKELEPLFYLPKL